MEIFKKLSNVQMELKSPKSQFNSFGNYKYRNCEDIMEAVKPLLHKNGLTMYISDTIKQVDNRFYIVSDIILVDVETGDKIETSAMAREEESKKGMDSMQLTGSTSSYSRKYALSGLFLIDDQKDSDFNNKGNSTATKTQPTAINEPNEETETRRNLKNLLFLVDKDNMESLLEDLTGFKGKDGKEVVGINDFEKLNGQRLSITYSKAQKIYKKEFETLKKKMKK